MSRGKIKEKVGRSLFEVGVYFDRVVRGQLKSDHVSKQKSYL